MDTQHELIGKTIKNAEIIGHNPDFDDRNVLVLEMTDGNIYYVEGGYGDYTGKSSGEYRTWVEVNTEIED